MQAVDHEPAPLVLFNQTGVEQDPQVMRDIHHLLVEGFGDFADGTFSVTQQIDDPQPGRFRQGLQFFRTQFGLKPVFSHGLVPAQGNDQVK